MKKKVQLIPQFTAWWFINVGTGTKIERLHRDFFHRRQAVRFASKMAKLNRGLGRG